jgi:Ca-activated chloride channel family protein
VRRALFRRRRLVRSVGGRRNPRRLARRAPHDRPGLAVGARTAAQVLAAAEVDASVIDIVLAIDLSGSMRALDFELEGKRANRLDAVKAVVRKFIEARPDDRLGMVVFAGRPYLASPLTLDHDWLTQMLERAKIGMVEDGTAVGSAIAASTNRLRDRKSKSRVIILLTDGMNNAGKISPLTAAEADRALGVRIYTIGRGRKDKRRCIGRGDAADRDGRRRHRRRP